MKPARKRAPKKITPEQALQTAKALLEQKQEHDRQPAPWQQLDENGHGSTQGAGFVSSEAAGKALIAQYDDHGETLVARIKQQIRTHTTPHHVPDKVVQVEAIPRTRSGKIVELAVRNVIHGRPVKNTDALANPQALELYRNVPGLSDDL